MYSKSFTQGARTVMSYLHGYLGAGLTTAQQNTLNKLLAKQAAGKILSKAEKNQLAKLQGLLPSTVSTIITPSPVPGIFDTSPSFGMDCLDSNDSPVDCSTLSPCPVLPMGVMATKFDFPPYCIRLITGADTPVNITQTPDIPGFTTIELPSGQTMYIPITASDTVAAQADTSAGGGSSGQNFLGPPAQSGSASQAPALSSGALIAIVAAILLLR